MQNLHALFISEIVLKVLDTWVPRDLQHESPFFDVMANQNTYQVCVVQKVEHSNFPCFDHFLTKLFRGKEDVDKVLQLLVSVHCSVNVFAHLAAGSVCAD